MPYTVIGGIGVMELGEGVSMANPANVMTLNNQVMFCGDLEATTSHIIGETLTTLSETSMAPDEPVYLPVACTVGGVRGLHVLTISPLGELSVSAALSPGDVVHLNGIEFTSNSQYYTPEIGNIYNDGTSPLSET